jgi:hypothetical protein
VAPESIHPSATCSQFHDPWLLDRTTGVTYSMAWLFQDHPRISLPGLRLDLPMTLREDLKEHSRVVGIVRANRVAWLGTSVDPKGPQTTLLIESV